MLKKRSTRRAFGRRALAFGIAMFAMVTLTAVGFAAWLISSDATKEVTGNVQTETVTQASIKIEAELETDNNIKFAPVEDTKGLVQYVEDVTNNYTEKLSVAFASGCTIANMDKVRTLTFSIKVPESIIYAAGLEKNASGVWTYDPLKAYVALPDYATDMAGNNLPKVVKSNDSESWDIVGETSPITFSFKEAPSAGDTVSGITITKPATGNTWTFSGSMTFGWGARYLGLNPNYYYDKNERVAGSSKTDPRTTNANEVMLDLIELQAAVHGIQMYSDGKVYANALTKEEYNDLDTSLSFANLPTRAQFVAELTGDKAGTILEALQTLISKKYSDTTTQYTIVISAQTNR